MSLHSPCGGPYRAGVTRIGFAMGIAATVVALTASCAEGDGNVDLGEGSADAGRDAKTPDAIVIPEEDSGTVETDSGKDSGGGNCDGKVVINEIGTRGGSANDEFIEIYNPGTCAVPLGGWTLKYRSKTNGAGAGALYTFATGESVAAKGYFVVGTSSFGGQKDATMTGGLADDGQVGLLDDTDKLIDGIGYGSGTTGLYTEGSAAPAPPASGSVGRKVDGVDTNNNASDCKAFTTHSAGAANP